MLWAASYQLLTRGLQLAGNKMRTADDHGCAEAHTVLVSGLLCPTHPATVTAEGLRVTYPDSPPAALPVASPVEGAGGLKVGRGEM